MPRATTGLAAQLAGLTMHAAAACAAGRASWPSCRRAHWPGLMPSSMLGPLAPEGK
jgi:hypothetical protein